MRQRTLFKYTSLRVGTTVSSVIAISMDTKRWEVDDRVLVFTVFTLGKVSRVGRQFASPILGGLKEESSSF